MELPSQMTGKVVFEQERSLSAWQKALDSAGRRLLDLLVAFFGLLLLSPLFAFVALLIRRDSGGPVFYRGMRVGRAGRIFGMLKFRTMYERPEGYTGPKITGWGDRRITPVGQWLRETKLNELPQLWNVLLGDMSLVGPRPEDPAFVAEWPEEIYHEILSVRPGITSPASVLYRDEERLLGRGNPIDNYLSQVLPSKLRLDLIYVRHRTLLSDLDVLFWTVLALLPQLRQKQVPEHALFWGPLARFINRYFSWFVVDFVIALGAVTLSGLIYRSSHVLDLGLSLALAMALAIAAVFSSINALLGLQRIYWSRADAGASVELAISTGFTTGIVALLNYAWQPIPLLPWDLLALSGLLTFLGFLTVRYRTRVATGLATRWVRWRRDSQAMGERVLVVGAGEVGNFGLWILRNSPLAHAFHVVGIVDDSPRKQGRLFDTVPVLGTTAEIPALVDEHDIGLLLYAIAEIKPVERDRILSLCGQTSAYVVSMPDVLSTVRFHFSPAGDLSDGSGFTASEKDRGLTYPERFHERLRCLDALVAAGAWTEVRGELREMENAVTAEIALNREQKKL